WSRTLEALGSDLAVHGLAYLGVLLFLVGAFGLVAFAFGDVSRELRPAAEAVIVIAPFAAGAILRRRNADVVGRALELAGGLILPIMLGAAFLDGVALPPDLTGASLAVALTAVTAAVALTYAAWTWRHPSTALRYLVAPIGWLTVAMATLGVGREIPIGKAVATPSVAQVAFMALALAVSALWARLRPGGRLAAPTLVAAMPGLVVLGVLAPLVWSATSDAPASAVLLTGGALLVGLECVQARLQAVVPAIVEPVWWTVVWLALVGSVGLGGTDGAIVSLLAAAGFIAILEVANVHRRPIPARSLPAVGLIFALLASLAEPAWAAAAFTTAAGWSVWRRSRPFGTPQAPLVHDIATAALPVGAVAALAGATDPAIGLLAAAGWVLLVAVLARRGWLTRAPGEAFWTLWWAAGTVVVALLAAMLWTDQPGTRDLWSVAGCFALLAVASGFAPVPHQWRPGLVVALGCVTWLAAAEALSLAPIARLSVLSAAGLAMVGLAHLAGPAGRRRDAVGIGLAGHAIGLAAIALAAQTRWALVVATGLATAGWSVTVWRDARGRSVVGDAVRRLDPIAAWAPYGLMAVGLPATAALLLDRSEVLPFTDPWVVAVPAGTALLYAAAAWLGAPQRVAIAAAWAGFAAGIVAPLTATSRVSAATGLAALILTVIVVPKERRAWIMVWVAWVAPAPAVGLVARESWPWLGGLPLESAGAVTLVAAGSVLLVGAAAADLRGRAWEPRARPAHAWALAPAVIGAAEVAAALALVASRPGQVAGWVCVVAARGLQAPPRHTPARGR
ncbi:MAG: hypothetical protein L0H25_10805, partial [Micrococcales bacterium]|nr:hypothetical protein [Micrococcales bacterium]